MKRNESAKQQNLKYFWWIWFALEWWWQQWWGRLDNDMLMIDDDDWWQMMMTIVFRNITLTLFPWAFLTLCFSLSVIKFFTENLLSPTQFCQTEWPVEWLHITSLKRQPFWVNLDRLRVISAFEPLPTVKPEVVVFYTYFYSIIISSNIEKSINFVRTINRQTFGQRKFTYDVDPFCVWLHNRETFGGPRHWFQLELSVGTK